MEQVVEMMKERQEKNNRFVSLMLENAHKRNVVQMELKKSQVEVNYQRKLRKLWKEKGMNDCEGSPALLEDPKRHLTVSDIDLKIPFKSAVLRMQSRTSERRFNSDKRLAMPKKVTKEFTHGIRSEKNLKSLHAALEKMNLMDQRDNIRCKSRKNKTDLYSEVIADRAISNDDPGSDQGTSREMLQSEKVLEQEEFITDVIKRVEATIAEMTNKKILKCAEQQAAEDILNKILPSVASLIAEKEAQEFMQPLFEANVGEDLNLADDLGEH